MIYKLNNLNAKNLEIFLICAIPYFLVFSIFLADLSIVILCLVFIYKIFKDNKIKLDLINNNLFKILFIYWAYISLTSFFSEDASLKTTIFYLRFILFPFIIFNLIIYNKKFLKFFLISTILLLVILFFDGVTEYFFGSNLLGYEKYEIGRVASLFHDEYIYGTFFLKLFFPISAIIYHLSEPNKKKIFFVSFYLLSFFCIFISGDRTPLMLFIISSIIIFLIFKTKLFYKIIFGLFVISFFTSFLIMNSNHYERIINRTLVEFGSEEAIELANTRLTKFTYNEREITFMPQHQTYFIIAINMFKDKPFFGQGTRSFKKLSCEKKYRINNFSCSSHPHNYYLQTLSENGLFGFLFLFLLFLYILSILILEIFKKKENSLPFELQILILGIFINLYPLTQTGNFYGNWNSIVFYLPIGFYYGMRKIIFNKTNFY